MWMKGIDCIDNKIINLLLEDGRLSYSEIAERVGLTRTAIKNRISALEEKGIIEGYRAVINPHNVPEMMSFIINIETIAEKFEQTKEYLVTLEETHTIIQTTGNCHLMAICVVPDVKTMREFVNSVYRKMEGITSINAHAVLDVIKGTIIPEK